MVANANGSYLKDPLYQLALRHLQEGQWEAGLSEVDWLMERYPYEHDLRALRQDFLLRAKIDSDERADRAVEQRGRLRSLTRRTVIGVLAVAVAAWGLRTYSVWLRAQLEAARQRISHEVQVVELNARLRDADAYLLAGRPADAQRLLQEVAAVDPSFPGLQEAWSRAHGANALDTLYAEAAGLMQARDWESAEVTLQKIIELDPNYRDASLQLAEVERQRWMGELLKEAENHFQLLDWPGAVSAYEGLRAIDPEFEPELVTERLFISYVNAARSVLVGQSDSLEALSLAEGYFRKALALRPQNAEIKVERELARQYLQAQADFTAGRWGEVIRALEIVHAHEPWYALGTSRQTLYEAYVARGDGYMANGEFDSALSDYQRAVQLAEQDEEAVLRLYEAQIRLGDAQAAQGNFEAAVVHYRSAVEVSGLRQRALQDNPAAAAALQEAQEYTGLGNFAVAYERYRRAIRLAGSTQRTAVHVVQSQEYLTLIASRYGSTVRSIVLANGIENPNLIFPGQELIVPVLP